ncbi:HNH endonuclease [Nocardia sp. NPDC001965]
MGWTSSNRRSRLPADWASRRSQVLRRDDYVCQLRWNRCLGTATEADHIRRGDNHSIENLQAACQRCHARKSSAEGNARQAEIRSRRKRPTERHPGSL